MLWRQGQQELLLDLILGREPGSAPGLCQQVLAVVDAATRDPLGEENTAPAWPLLCSTVLADCWLYIPPNLCASSRCPQGFLKSVSVGPKVSSCAVASCLPVWQTACSAAPAPPSSCSASSRQPWLLAGGIAAPFQEPAFPATLLRPCSSRPPPCTALCSAAMSAAGTAARFVLAEQLRLTLEAGRLEQGPGQPQHMQQASHRCLWL